MFLHIGGDYQVPIRLIIGIFDFDEITREANPYMINTLARLEEQFVLETVSPDIPRSLIISVDRVYLSPINSITLEARLKNMYSLGSIEEI